MNPTAVRKLFPTLSDRFDAALDDFRCARDAANRVTFVQTLLKKDELTLTAPPKDDQRATEARERAVALIGRRELARALELLNESLAFAGEAPENHYLAYAARGHIYEQMGLKVNAARNYQAAIQHHHPDAQRLARLVDALAEAPPVNGARKECETNGIHLTYPPHPKVSFIADCIELAENAEYGRHIITRRPLKPGDVVIVEKPFSATLSANARFQRCAMCASTNVLDLLPCEGCNWAMFCSRRCAEEAAAQFHRVECPIGAKVLEWFGDEAIMALRNVLLAFEAYDDLEELKALVEDPAKDKENAFRLNYNQASQKQLLEALLSLTTIEKCRNTPDLFCEAQVAAVFYELLVRNTPLTARLPDAAAHRLLKELLFQFAQTALINTFLMASPPPLARTATHLAENTFGIATYLFSSFLSHSCAANVGRVNVGVGERAMLVFALRPVAAGEKLCNAYDGMNYCERPRAERQRHLAAQYYFECGCQACAGHWPTKERLSSALKQRPGLERVYGSFGEQNGLLEADKQRLASFDRLFAEDRVGEYAALLQLLDEHRPCREICELEEMIRNCFRVQFSKRPFYYK